MDNTRKTVLALGFVSLVTEYAFVNCDGIPWTKYHYNGNTGHKHTPNEKVVQSEVKAAFTCGKLCHSDVSCNSFSYQPGTGKCTGCSTLHCGLEPTDSTQTMFFSTAEESSGRKTAHALRLTGGKHMTEGRLEVKYNGQWGTVCNESFGTEEAMVACNMLNYTTNNPNTYLSADFSQRSLPILLGNVSCFGSEKNLLECSHRAWGENSCRHGGEVGISCPPSISVRLAGGYFKYGGRLQVEYNGQWGTVCLDGFGKKEAIVVCNMLNLTWASVKTSAGYLAGPYDSSTLPILLDNVLCSGSEKNLLECSHRALGEASCSSGDEVGITCAPNLHIRLMEGNLPKSGRVEVSLDGVQWGTVCRDELGVPEEYDNVAKTVCRMLGYTEGATMTVGKPGTLPMLMYVDTYACSGPEESLLLCVIYPPGNRDCNPSNHVSVECH